MWRSLRAGAEGRMAAPLRLANRAAPRAPKTGKELSKHTDIFRLVEGPGIGRAPLDGIYADRPG